MFYLTLPHLCRAECGNGFSSLISSSANFSHSFNVFFFDLLLVKFGGPHFALPSLDSSRRMLLVRTLLTNLSERPTGQHLRTKFNPSACNKIKWLIQLEVINYADDALCSPRHMWLLLWSLILKQCCCFLEVLCFENLRESEHTIEDLFDNLSLDFCLKCTKLIIWALKPYVG